MEKEKAEIIAGSFLKKIPDNYETVIIITNDRDVIIHTRANYLKIDLSNEHTYRKLDFNEVQSFKWDYMECLNRASEGVPDKDNPCLPYLIEKALRASPRQLDLKGEEEKEKYFYNLVKKKLEE